MNIFTERIAGYVKRSSVRFSARLSIIRPPQAAAAGLLLWARRAGDIDRLPQGRAPCSSGAAARCTAANCVQQQMRAVSH